MKTKLLAAGIAACFAVPAMAQSSVTIYGIADAGVMYVKNGGQDAKTKLVSGIADGSRLGSVSYTHLTLPTIYSV